MTTIPEILEKLEHSVDITLCEKNYADKSVLEISWVEKGRGFGTYTFYQDENGNWRIDDECDGRDAIKRIMCRLIDKLPIDSERNKS